MNNEEKFWVTIASTLLIVAWYGLLSTSCAQDTSQVATDLSFQAAVNRGPVARYEDELAVCYYFDRSSEALSCVRKPLQRTYEGQ